MIALIDCDNFFVSCEQAENPKLHGLSVCVTTGENGCIVSRSSEAKKLGIKMGEPYFMARQKHPTALYLPARHELYHQYSSQVMDCLRTFTPDVEVYSIDEAYMNLRGLDRLYKKSFPDLAAEIRTFVWQQCNIPVSIGISLSKTLAKLASDKAKSRGGVFLINAENLQQILEQTEISAVCGFGRRQTEKMKMFGIFDCRQFVDNSDSWIRQTMGIKGLNLKYELLGHSINPVSALLEKPKSIQNTSALSKFTSDVDVLRASLKYHAHLAGRKLRIEDCYCRQIGVLLRTKDFQTSCLYHKMDYPTNSEKEIFNAATSLLQKMYNPCTIYRSSGIIMENLISREQFQPNLFAKPEYYDDKISRLMDELEQKFGKDVIKNGLF